MGMTTSLLTQQADAIGQVYDALCAADAHIQEVISGAKAGVLATGDLSLIQTVLMGSKDYDDLSADTLFKSIAFRKISALSIACGAAGLTETLTLPGGKQSIVTVKTLPDFAAYYNTGAGGAWQCLLSPAFAHACAIVKATAIIPATCVYAPANANLGSLAYGGTPASLGGTDAAQYAGFAAMQATLTGGAFSSTGSGTLTVTGRARTEGGDTADGRTWTATLIADGVVALTPTAPSDLLLTVMGISLPTRLSAGTVQISGIAPVGR